MVDLQTISVLIATVSVTLAAAYYFITFRDSRKTRRIQLFMQFFDKMQTVDFHRLLHDVYNLEWDDPADFEERYGVLVNDGVIDARFIYEWDSYRGILMMWEHTSRSSWR